MGTAEAISAVKTDPLTELTEGILAIRIELNEAKERIDQLKNGQIDIKGNRSLDIIDDVSNFAIFLTARVALGSLLKGTVINCCADSTPNYHWTKFKVLYDCLVENGMPKDAMAFLSVDGPSGKQ